MSRVEAKKAFTKRQMKDLLIEKGIHLLSAGLDEIPMAYKDIDSVMAAQKSLVEVVARFDPKMVRMADGKDKPED